MHLWRMNRFLGLSALVTLAAFGAGCDTLSKWQNYAENEPANPDAFSPHASPAIAAPQVSLPAKDPHAFTIGAVLPLTGSRVQTGQMMQRGLQLAIGEINAVGGVNGQPVQLAVLDSRSDLEMGETALGAFRDYGEAVLLVGDGPLAVDRTEQLAGYPAVVGFLCDYVAGPKLTPKNGVRIYLNGDQEGRAIEGYVEAAGIDRVAVLHQSDLLSESNKQYVLYLFSGNHRIFTTEEGYSATEQNFTLLGQAMLRVNTGALVFAGYGPEYGKILGAFETAGWQGTVLGYAEVGGLSNLPGTGRLASTAAYPLPDFASNPRSTVAGRAFMDLYRAKYNADPDLPAAYAYDTVHALADAAKQAASSDPQKIRAGFITQHTYTGAVGRYDIKDDGDTEMPLYLMRADGQALPPPSKPAATEFPRLSAPSAIQP